MKVKVIKMGNKREELSNKPIFSLFIKYFIPTLIGSVVIVLYNIVDRFFIGKVNEIALAGAGVAFYFVMLLIAFSMLVGVGSGSLFSLKLGKRKKNRKEAEKILGNTVAIFTIFGIILYIVLKLNLDKLLLLAGANDEVLPYARAYLDIILFAILPLFYSYGLTNVLNAAGTPRIGMFSLMLGGVINIVLDYVAVMILKMGIEGTAYATLIGNLLAAIFVLYFLIKGKLPFKINLFGYELEQKSEVKLRLRYLKLDYKIVKDILSIGMPPFLLQAASAAVGFITNGIVQANGGTYGLAVVTIINSYLPIMTISVYSIAQAVQPIIGFNYSSGNYKRVKSALYTAIFSGLILSTIFWVIVMAIPKSLILIFNEKSTINSLKEGVKALRIYFSLIIPASLGIIIPNYFQATGRPRYAVILNLLRQVFIFLLVVIIFARIWKLDGVWYAQPFTDGLFAVVLIIFLFFETRMLNKKIKENM